MAETALWEWFAQAAAARGVALDSRQLGQFQSYASILREWNERMNLTAIVEEQAIVVKHFIDCLEFVARMGLFSGDLILDVGSGAGFPGLVIQIVRPDVRVSLCDSLQKRVRFLEHLSGQLGLQQVTCIHGRAEDLARLPMHRDRYQMVTARAVAKLSVLSEWCLPFVSPGGRFVAMKGPGWERELAEATVTIARLRAAFKESKHYELPRGEGERSLLVIDKVGRTPVGFPRRPGEAARSPLVD